MTDTNSSRTRRGVRAVAASAALMVGLTGVAACSDSAGPEAGEVTTDDLQDLEEDLTALEDRIGVLEADLKSVDETPGADGVGNGVEDEFWLDTETHIGEEVTISAGVSDLVTSTDAGAAYRIADDSGEAITIISANPPAELELNDVVKVTGTVVEIQRDSFEEDFGLAEDELFDDPDAFFEEDEGGIGIAVDRMEVLQEQEG